MTNRSELLGISNAIVDVLAKVSPELLSEMQAVPGSMTLIDADEAERLSQTLVETEQMSGGSVSNSVAAFAALGGSAAYIGRIADDRYGTVFSDDMLALGVAMRLPPETRKAPTARSFVLITPDGQRTMRTFLGACTEIDTNDITSGTIGDPGFLLLEGYLWDTPYGYDVAAKAIEIADKTTVVLSLSDAECVNRHHGAFADIIHSPDSIVIGNETEFTSLLGTTDIDEMAGKLQRFNTTAVITRSEHGSVIVTQSGVSTVAAKPIEKLIDTTGAGDAFMGGFIYGLTQNESLEKSANIGSECAAAVVQQVGARYRV